jgi:glycosyltransferase involved in cell wall biosynthesis
MKKKLIIFIPSIEDGGVEKNLFIISNYLSSKINNIELITCNNNYKNKFSSKINIISPNNSFFWNKKRLIKYLICLAILFYRILLNNRRVLIFAFQANIYSILIAKILNIRIITRSNSSPSGWSKNYLKNLFFKFLLKKADEIIVNSLEFQKEFYSKFKIKTKLIYNPFDKNFINEKLKKKIKNNFFSKNNLKIINVGRLTEQKDQITLLKSFKLIDPRLNAKLLIIGKGIKQDFLKKYIISNNLCSKVKLLGYADNPFSFMKLSDIVVLSSKFEGLPNVLLEAQYLKKYIISTDCPTGPREILLNGKYGDLIKIGDYKNLAKKINDYYKNKKLKNKMILKGFKAMSRFDYKINCNKYFQLINNYI